MSFKETADIRTPNWDNKASRKHDGIKWGNPEVVVGTRPEPFALDWTRRLRFLQNLT